jgi:hypothetical protein
MIRTAESVIASGQAAGRLFGDVMPWVLALLGATLVGAVAIYAVRRWLRRTGESTNGFTLQDLRTLHSSGELTDDEFARAKAAMIGRMRDGVEQNQAESDVSTGSDTSDSTRTE